MLVARSARSGRRRGKRAPVGHPPYMTRSTSSTPSALSCGSSGVRSPDQSASIRWISASWAWRRRMKPMVWSSDQVQAGVSGAAAASDSCSTLLARW